MAYTKQTWADLPSKTTPINAERLTHIEDGIFNAAQTADTAASTAGTAAANVGIVSGKVETLTERVNGLDTAVSNKVDKVAGKGLSTNDYDNTDKSKVDSLGTASTKNSTSVVTQSTDLVESGAVKDIVGWGNKNLWEFGDFTGIFTNVPFSLPAGTYTFSFSSNNPVGIRLFYNENDSVAFSGASPLTIVLEQPVVKINYSCNDSTATNVQLEVGSTATSYEPYHASVEETLKDAEVVEGKNLLDWSKESQTINGITFTVNEDKSITANGTTTAGAAFILINSNSVYNREILGKSLKFTGCPQGGSESTYNLYLSTWGTTSAVTDYGSGAEINIPSSINGFRVDVAIKPNQTVSNLVFKPMLSLDGGEYEPYYTPLKDVVPNKCDNSVIGTVEDGANPTKSYEVGEHMVRGGKFCTVTVAVTTSSTWTLGSNYVEGDVASALDVITTTVSDLVITKCNKFVTVNYLHSVTITAGVTAQIGDIPSGFRPSFEVYGVAITPNSDIICRVAINASGNVFIRSVSSFSGVIGFNISYPI